MIPISRGGDETLDTFVAKAPTFTEREPYEKDFAAVFDREIVPKLSLDRYFWRKHPGNHGR